jgi:FHS family L-fucose permease-like MFS transporter
MDLTILETAANPYTTVLGPKQFAATRINFAQSFNGVGWIFGPIIGGIFFYSSEGAEAAQKQLYIPYIAVAIVVLVMATIFYFANVPDLNTKDEYHLSDNTSEFVKRSIWLHPHFWGTVIAQFVYEAAQAGIFSFFINYIIEEIPSISNSLANSWIFKDRAVLKGSDYFVNEKGATFLLGTIGFPRFLIGRATGAAIRKKLKVHRVLGTYALLNVFLCGVIVLRIGWFSVTALFLSFLFMSIMFPTIFALGIFGLGVQAKKASGFIVMAIIGGAIMPKLMGYLGDIYNMSFGFLMPLGRFTIVSLYGFMGPKLSKTN